MRKPTRDCLVGFFVGLRGDVFFGFYSFLPIYLEVKIFFAIFAVDYC